MKDNKIRNRIFFFLSAMAGIVVIMVIANYKSELIMQIKDPPDGTRKLFTVDNELVSVSQSNHIYIWDWDKLSAQPIKTQVSALDVTLMSGRKLIWAPASGANKIFVTDINGLEVYSEILLDNGWRCKFLRTSQNGKFTTIGSTKTDKDNNLQLGVIDSSFKAITNVTIVTDNNDFALRNIAISNDGTFITAVGKNNKGGWIAVADVANKKILWKKSILQTTKLNDVAFSIDGTQIYAGGQGKTIYAFETATGLAGEERIIGGIKGNYRDGQDVIVQVVISSDGRLLAAGGPYNGIIVWKLKDSKRIIDFSPEHTIFSALALSPDSTTMATADLRDDGHINVWRIRN